ncbi:hypothetical protein L7F22_025387 [Adiantum nelumboides]|nr:hypothetical protein [Adiantum nelumboides]
MGGSTALQAGYAQTNLSVASVIPTTLPPIASLSLLDPCSLIVFLATAYSVCRGGHDTSKLSWQGPAAVLEKRHGFLLGLLQGSRCLTPSPLASLPLRPLACPASHPLCTMAKLTRRRQ